jgi:hypothetical protein
MPAKTDEHKRKGKQDVPSTGRGAASAMDALIKRRVPPPGNPASAPAPPGRKH